MGDALQRALEAVRRTGRPTVVPPPGYLGLPWWISRDAVVFSSPTQHDGKPLDIMRPCVEGLPPKVDYLRVSFAVWAANMHHRTMTALEDAVPLLRAMQVLSIKAPAANTTARELADRIVELIREDKSCRF